jgi:hypothetical protein
MVCNSLGVYAPDDCYDAEMPGAISFLRQDIFDAHAFVIDSTEETTVLAYILAAILSFMPLVLMFFAKQFTSLRENKEMWRWLIFFSFSALLGSVPLLWFAADYGRIIYIHVTCLSLLALMACQEENRNELQLNFSLREITPWILVLLFIGNWRVMHTKATIDNTFHIVNILFALFYDK